MTKMGLSVPQQPVGDVYWREVAYVVTMTTPTRINHRFTAAAAGLKFGGKTHF